MTDTLIFTDSVSSPVTKTVLFLFCKHKCIKKDRKLNNIKIASANLEIDFYLTQIHTLAFDSKH